jgi:hypothetical protein
MSRRATNVAASNRTIIDDDDCATGACKKVGGSKSGNARADDADRSSEILFQTRYLGRITRGHPH